LRLQAFLNFRALTRSGFPHLAGTGSNATARLYRVMACLNDFPKGTSKGLPAGVAT
jgi:hypothetical protein